MLEEYTFHFPEREYHFKTDNKVEVKDLTRNIWLYGTYELSEEKDDVKVNFSLQNGEALDSIFAKDFSKNSKNIN